MGYLSPVHRPLLSLAFLLLVSALTRAQTLRITEFMADPNPVVGLPDAEYVEIHNYGTVAVPLAPLAVASGGRAAGAGVIEDTLGRGEYLVLTRPDDAAAFAALDVRVLALDLPGLTNAGDVLTLLYGGDTLQHLEYSADWYHDPDRDGGGHSLEYTGTGADDCGGHWRGSTAAAGGTPGRPNATLGQGADSRPPRALSASIDAQGVAVHFDEPVATGLAFTVAGRDRPYRTLGGSTYRIDFPAAADTVYALTILADYADCAGNFADRDTTIDLLYGTPPAPGELVINEIMFDPLPGEEDFVEVYNTGVRPLSLQGITVTNEAGSARPVTLTGGHVVRPGGYAVLSPAPQRLAARYPLTEPQRVVHTDLPALSNTSGTVTLTGPDGALLDRVVYRAEYHASLLRDAEGISLERLRTDRPAVDADHWASAAAAAGYATPTRPNSQAAGVGEFTVDVAVQAFSPDGDGYQDDFVLEYRHAPPESLAALRVFDLEGRRVTAAAAPELLAANGQLRWNGRRAEGGVAAPGPYVILLELFDPAGNVRRHKLTAVVAPTR